MRNLLNVNTLVTKISDFNKIFALDSLTVSNEKSWSEYLNPISLHLFGINYADFITNNKLVFPNPPGTFERYYNFFQVIVSDLKHLVSLKIPNQIYFSALDVLSTFEDFLKTNNFNVNKDKTNINGKEVFYYYLFPTI